MRPAVNLIILLITAGVLSAAEFSYDEILFVPWGNFPGEAGISEAPGGNYGPSSFAVDGDRVILLDTRHKNLNIYRRTVFERSLPVPLSYAENFFFRNDDEIYYQSDNSIVKTLYGRVTERIPVENPRHRISDIFWNEKDSKLVAAVNYNYYLQEDMNGKGRYMLFNGIPLPDGETVRVVRASVSECDVLLNGNEAFSLNFRALALSRFLGLSPAGNFYIYIEEYDEIQPLRVKRKVILVDRQGQILSEILIPRLAHSYIYREFFVDGSGNFYKMFSTPDGIYICGWYPLNEDDNTSPVYEFPEKFQSDYHYSDPPVPEPEMMDSLFTEPDSIMNNSLDEQSGYIPASPSGVNPEEAIAIAETYIDHVWTASSVNIAPYLTTDPGGRHVQTPDWVQVGENRIFPYRWGGFESLDQFDAGLLAGKYAGDIATDEVSYYAVGVDCSGFVSRCWKLSTHYSTSMMNSTPSLFQFHDSWEDIRPGDAVHKVGHVRLHIARNDDGSLFVVESTGNGWRVRYSTYTLSDLSSYRPMYYVNMDGTPGILPQPQIYSLSEKSSGGILDWRTGVDSSLYAGYRLYSAVNDGGTTIVSGGDSLPPSRMNWSYNPESSTLSSFFLRSIGLDGSSLSIQSDIYSARTGNSGTVLIVDGFDRMDSYALPYHDFSMQLAGFLAEEDLSIASVDNDGLGRLPGGLSDFDAVFWILGDESTADETFSQTEQLLVTDYLKEGGKLFVSGSEIAWDLDYKGLTADKSFCANYLKLQYKQDDADSYRVKGASGTLFADIDFSYDDGSAGIYEEDYPDAFNAVNGSSAVLKYDNGLTAAVAFKGNYGSGSEGAVFIMGLPFETIIDTQDQRALVSAVLEYFGLPDGASPVAAADPGDFILYGNYPNPFNITTGIRVNTPANAEMVCSVYDILGRKIMSRNFGVISAGLHTLPMDMSGVASGTYFYSVETGGSSLPGKFTLLK